MASYLTMTAGGRTGTRFRLDPDRVNRIGRGLDCAIVLSDPLCSRVHATIEQEDEQWVLRDAGSRNGTFVNGQKIDDATLTDGCDLRLGSTEFSFLEADDAGDVDAEEKQKATQTIIRDQFVSATDADPFVTAALSDAAAAQRLVDLYQLTFKLLACADPTAVVHTALELLRERSGAAVVGFLWVDEAGHLKPKFVLPEDAGDKVQLSESLTKLVLNERRAVWTASRQSGALTKSLQQFADALCIPLVYEGDLLGALHVYREQGRFDEANFDFTMSLANILARALVRARHQTSVEMDLEQLAAQSPGYDEMIGESPQMLNLKEKIDRLARATGCVLIRGESGTGKELVTRAIHRASPRADRPLLSVNCAAIPRELVESQLFGHQAGAFTSADRDHVGYFQQADLGTLFLDEVGELPLEGQAKLLRILEGHPFHPVGGSEEISVDVRVIAATNQDLETHVREKRFREDLYYRLSVFELFVPPLRERGEDLDRLTDAFLEHFRRQHGRASLELSQAARDKLQSYRWPGNVRQLRNVLDSAVVLADGDRIEPGDLGLRDTGEPALESLKIADWEERLIGEAIRRTDGNVVEAAKLLGLGRATLYRKLDEYGIKK